MDFRRELWLDSLMQIELREVDSWNRLNDRLKQQLLPNESKVSCQAYRGVGHAIFDLAQGLKNFLPHKRTLVVMRGGDPYVELLLPEFYREGFQIQFFLPEELQNLESWYGGLNKDALAVVASSDHAFTGEILLPEGLSEFLAQKRLPLIEINHSLHFVRPIEPTPFQAIISQFSNQRAVGLLGARFRVFPQSAQMMEWDNEVFLKGLEKRGSENRELILQFESTLPLPLSPYFFEENGGRLYDRSLFLVDPMSGTQFLNLLVKELGDHAGLLISKDYDTTHACRPGGLHTLEWWGREKLDDKVSISLVALSLELIQFPNFNQIIKAVTEKGLRELQF